VALVLVELLLSAMDLLLGPFLRVHWEERFNARNGVLFACGHLDAAFDLQYRTFCGGCTTESLVAAPLFRGLGASHLVWKLVPELFHALITAAGAALAGRAGGARAAAAFAALMLGAPGVYRELAHTGWGNHAESTALPAMALLLLLATGRGSILRALAFSAAAGLLAGFGLWFAHISGHLLPALLLVGALVRWRALPALLLGLPLGAAPWWLYHQDRPEAQRFAEGWMSAVQPAPLGRWLDWLWGADLRAGLWDRADYAQSGPLPDLYWFALWGLAALGALWAWRGRASLDRRQQAAALVGPLGLLGLMLAYLLRYDLWSNLPDPYGVPSFNLRYRVPMWPMLALCAAVAAALCPARLRRPVALAIGALALFGLLQRASLWSHQPSPLLGLRVFLHDGWSDGTVPLGQPPQPRAEAQGRPVDLAAALAFLDDHRDPLPECRDSHLFELGRRLGLALGEGRLDLDPSLQAALAATGGDPAASRLLAYGIAKGLSPKGELDRPALLSALDRLAAWELDGSVGRELGALGRERLPEDGAEDFILSLDPRLGAGLCWGLGQHRVEEATDGGTGRLDGLDLGEAGPCADDPALWRGVGAGLGLWVGCGPDASQRIDSLGEPAAAAAREGWDLSCAEHRDDRGRP
jgi:hypothetical protein